MRLKSAGVLVALAFLCLPATASAGETPIEQRTIPEGMRAGGVDVGGLTVERAAALLDREAGAAVERDIVVRAAARRLLLRAERSQVDLDAMLTAKRAYYQGIERRPDVGEPVEPPHDVGLAITYSRKVVADFASFVNAVVGRPARSARVRIGITRLRRTRARTGVGVDRTALARKIGERLTSPSSSRQVVQPVRRTQPRVSNRALLRRYPAIVTIDRRAFRLRLFRRLRFSKAYPIALGAAGSETPAGFFRVRQKTVNPPWYAPNRPWAGAYAGRVVPGGAPDNPLKARWLGLANGIGIHGTAEEWSIGTRASRGCIRMRVRDVIDLYPRVPLGTTVRISR